MTTNQTIDGVSRATLEKALIDAMGSRARHSPHIAELRALLDEPVSPLSELEVLRAAVKELETMRDARVDAKLAQGEPVAFTAVGVLRDDGDGGFVPEWILEGGTAELWAGAVLLIADEDQELCTDDGHCELYRNPPEQPAPVAVVLPDLEPAFEKWWEEDGQYCRAGGGSYEKTFAYRAYEAALGDVTRLNTK
ncbi:hypothetical protein QLG25_18230 [Pseudomonas sp. CBR-F]